MPGGLEDVFDDDLEDELEDGGELEDDELSDEDLGDDELGMDYAVPDREVEALSAERGAALMRPKLLGSAVRLNPESSNDKKLSGGAEITRIIVCFANGRKLYLTP